MADINLLKNAAKDYGAENAIKRAINTLGVAVLLLSVAFGVWLTYVSESADKKIEELHKKQAQIQQEIKSDQSYDVIIKSQNKMKNLKLLLDSHIYWSSFFPAIFSVTTRSAAFEKLRVARDGSIVISGFVPDFQSLDKLMQAYQLNDSKSYIKDVKLTSIGIGSAKAGAINFTLSISFNVPKLLPNKPEDLINFPAGR